MSDAPFPIRVLLIDDSSLVGVTVEGMLAGVQGLKLRLCTDPRLALEAALEFQPTVVLLDLGMPDVGGMAVAQQFRQHSEFEQVPLVVLSVESEPEEKASAFAAGADDYLVKWPHEVELVARLTYHSRSYFHLQQRNRAEKALRAHQTELEWANKLLSDVNAQLEQTTKALEQSSPSEPPPRVPTEPKFEAGTSLPEDCLVRLLLVDDSPMVGVVLEGILESLEECEYHHCTDPRTALEVAREMRPTVILLDLSMPEVDGMAVADQFRRDKSLGYVPIVVLTVEENPEEKAAAFAGGADDYLVKWPHEVELLARIRYHSAFCRHLRQRDQAHAELELHQCELEWSNRMLSEANQHLENTSQALESARDEALLASAAKGSFLTNMGHELRTPMSGIIGLTQVLLGTHLESRQKDYLEKVSQAADTLGRLINDILDFSKLETGRLDYHPAPFSLRELLSGVMEGSRARAQAKGLGQLCQIEADLPDGLLLDSLRLSQILANLVDNAIKFTSEGEVKVEVWAENRTPTSLHLRFRITDTGIGIPAAKLNAIFSSFAQPDTSPTRSDGGAGTGLGLAIVKNLVQMMEGEIWVKSEVGKGAEFNLDIPCQTTAVPASTPLHSNEVQFTDLNILLAEDNPISQAVIVEFLQSLKHRIEVAENGWEALKMNRESHYDVILMDLRMPVMNGFEAVAQIRAEEKDRRIPIIALTASARQGEQERCLAAGMDAYLPKPVYLHDLRRTINRLITAPPNST